MTAAQAVARLNESFLRDYPMEAARELETLPQEDSLAALQGQPALVLARIWEHLLPDAAQGLLQQLSDDAAAKLLSQLDPGRSATLLERMEEAPRLRLMSLLSPTIQEEITQLLAYPHGSAGRLMDSRVALLREAMSVDQALTHLRQHHQAGSRLRMVFLLDEQGHLHGSVDLQDLLLAPGNANLNSLARPVNCTINAMAPREEVTQSLEQQRLEELPVVDIHGRLQGVIRSEALRHALHEASSADLLSMVGVSKEERALASPLSSARKRILWMHINLVTALVAASVVGLFEDTIATFTALAVLMPVVAGMGGNMGSQALAVTLRGLALREITVRHWLRILFKEARVGMINGLLLAFTTSMVVLLWSQNSGLALVIGLAMTISLSIACVAGAMVPLVLTRLGQDPAQASAIFLTTITDITGFMSFLGIATLLSSLLL